MSLQFDKKAAEEMLHDLHIKICPIVNDTCKMERCWKFVKQEKVAWKEEIGVQDKTSKRLKIVQTGKVVIGTIVKCENGIFPDAMIEARHAEPKEASIDKDGNILDENKQPWGGSSQEGQIIDIKTMEEDQKKEMESEIETEDDLDSEVEGNEDNPVDEEDEEFDGV